MSYLNYKTAYELEKTVKVERRIIFDISDIFSKYKLKLIKSNVLNCELDKRDLENLLNRLGVKYSDVTVTSSFVSQAYFIIIFNKDGSEKCLYLKPNGCILINKTIRSTPSFTKYGFQVWNNNLYLVGYYQGYLGSGYKLIKRIYFDNNFNVKEA